LKYERLVGKLIFAERSAMTATTKRELQIINDNGFLMIGRESNGNKLEQVKRLSWNGMTGNDSNSSNDNKLTF